MKLANNFCRRPMCVRLRQSEAVVMGFKAGLIRT